MATIISLLNATFAPMLTTTIAISQSEDGKQAELSKQKMSQLVNLIKIGYDTLGFTLVIAITLILIINLNLFSDCPAKLKDYVQITSRGLFYLYIFSFSFSLFMLYKIAVEVTGHAKKNIIDNIKQIGEEKNEKQKESTLKFWQETTYELLMKNRE